MLLFVTIKLSFSSSQLRQMFFSLSQSPSSSRRHGWFYTPRCYCFLLISYPCCICPFFVSFPLWHHYTSPFYDFLILILAAIVFSSSLNLLVIFFSSSLQLSVIFFSSYFRLFDIISPILVVIVLSFSWSYYPCPGTFDSPHIKFHCASPCCYYLDFASVVMLLKYYQWY